MPTKAIIRNRIEVYKEETSPVYDFYADKGKAVKVNGIGTIDEIIRPAVRRN